MSTEIKNGFQALSFYRVDCDAEKFVNPEHEIRLWLVECCEGKYYIAANRKTFYNANSGKSFVMVYLELETDAMALKLGWT